MWSPTSRRQLVPNFAYLWISLDDRTSLHYSYMKEHLMRPLPRSSNPCSVRTMFRCESLRPTSVY